MPQVSTIVLNDGTTNRSFTPVSVQPQGVSLLADRTLGIKNLESTLTLSSRETGTGAHSVKFKLTLPKIVTDASTGLQRVVDNAIGDVSLRFPADSTQAERLALIATVRSALADDLEPIASMVKNMESIW